MKQKKFARLFMIVAVFAFGILACGASVEGAPGDLIQNVLLPVEGIGVSVAVDCEGNVYYTVAADTNLYVMDKDGNLLNTLAIVTAAGEDLNIDEMAFQNSGGAGTLWGQLHGSNPTDVYTIDPVTGLASFAFTAAQSNSDGSFRDGIAFDGTDDTIWISGDVSEDIEHYELDGTFINSITATDAAGDTLGLISGITVGVGDLMYLGRNGAVEIVQVRKSDGVLLSSFASPAGARDEGLECDAVNFAPLLALWSRDFDDPGFMSVIEVDAGTCGCGGGEVICELGPVCDEHICKRVTYRTKDGDCLIEAGEKVDFKTTIEVINHTDDAWDKVVIGDCFFRDIVVTNVHTQHGSTQQFQAGNHKTCIRWKPGDLGPGDSATLVIDAETGADRRGRQEYTRCGEHQFNNGALLRFIDPHNQSFRTGPIVVSVLTPDAEGDCDGDGCSDQEELDGGTDPHNRSDCIGK